MMPVTRAADRDQKTLTRMLAKVEAMIEAVRLSLAKEEEHGDAAHAG